MEDLPAELTIDILSRLPFKTIVHCKRVCKKWRNLVSDSSFVDLHLSRSLTSPTGLLIQPYAKLQKHCQPGILKWADIEDKDDGHHLHPMSLDLNMVPIFQNSGISLKGSVNGLICLHQYIPENNTYIFNPVTREIMVLPGPQQDFEISACGFGVSSLTGEYKVVRTLHRNVPFTSEQYSMVPEAEVYTLGTGQWRSLGRVPYCLDESNVGAVLNDHCHWILFDYEDSPERICAFDLNKETFQVFPSPPIEESGYPFESDTYFQSLAILKGCLCKSDGNDSQFTIWVMKEYGIKKSWHKEVVIAKEALNRSREWPYWYNVSLIGGLKDGTIFFVSRSLWAFYPRTNTVEEIDTFEFSKSGLAYRPSFLTLQNFESEVVHMF